MAYKHYISLQFSAIQKTIFRLDRLWFMAGTSQIISRLNEITLPELVTTKGGKTLIAGGGKFTASFTDESMARKALEDCIECISTKLPMLEFQWAGPTSAYSLDQALREGEKALIAQLQNTKTKLRGYGVTFLPHVNHCSECGEYPAESNSLCRFCGSAKEEARHSLCDILYKKNLTTLEKIYHSYISKLPNLKNKIIPIDFNELNPSHNEEIEAKGLQMAVWTSDINNMKHKVNIWNQQPEENILSIFNDVLNVFSTIVSKALIRTFPNPNGKFLPFRLVIAGGDDLCIIMSKESIINFSINLSSSLFEVIKSLGTNHPLNNQWLSLNNKSNNNENIVDSPYCFGGSFIITSTHTPFRRIHAANEKLMKQAKKRSRKTNMVAWALAAEEEGGYYSVLPRENPIAITGPRTSLENYLAMVERHKASISKTAIYTLAAAILNKLPTIDEWLKARCADAEPSFCRILNDEDFLQDGVMDPHRLATFLELLCIINS